MTRFFTMQYISLGHSFFKPKRLFTALLSVAALYTTGCSSIPLQRTEPSQQEASTAQQPKEGVLDLIQAPGDDTAIDQQTSDIAKSQLIAIVKQAAQSPSPKKEALLLKATHTALKQSKPKLAKKIYVLIQPETLVNQGDLDYFYELIGLELAVAQKDVEAAQIKYKALDDISNSRRVPLSTRHYLEDSRIRSEALALQGQHLAAARLLVFRVGSLDFTDEDLQPWHDTIWNQISLYRSNRHSDSDAPQDLAVPTAQAPSDDWQAWLELSDLFDNIDKSQLSQIQSQLQNWKNDWSQIRLSAVPPTQVKEFMIADFKQAHHVAVFLPNTGNLRHAGKAIVDGIMAAYYQEQNLSKPNLRLTFYDTGSEEPIGNLYDQALLQGAEFIVGPLQKDQVQTLKDYIGSKPTDEQLPTLALNYLQNDNAKNNRYFFEFGLRAEDEAVAVADYARKQGYERALILRPDSDWGQRVSEAFTQEFTSKDGVILDEAAFTQPRQFSNEVQKLMGINESKARHAAMERRLGKELDYTPRRRQDVDFIFLLASPNEARQLKPTINYHYGQNIPVLATSHLYSGSSQPQFDKDLENIKFVDIPWILHPDEEMKAVFEQNIPNAQSQFKRLHALGIDSFKLMREFPILKHISSSEVEGTTGDLQVTSTGQVYRELSWAEFKKGQVIPIESDQE